MTNSPLMEPTLGTLLDSTMSTRAGTYYCAAKYVVRKANGITVGITRTPPGPQTSVSPRWTTHGLLHQTSPRDRLSGKLQVLPVVLFYILTRTSAVCQRMPGNKLPTAAVKTTASHQTKAPNNSQTPKQAKNSSSTPPLAATTATTASVNSNSSARTP